MIFWFILSIINLRSVQLFFFASTDLQFSLDCWNTNKYPNIYVTGRHPIQRYIRFLLTKCFMTLKGSVALMACLFLLVVQIFLELIQTTTQSVSRALLELYAQEWTARVNVSSKGNPYLLSKVNLNLKKK